MYGLTVTLVTISIPGRPTFCSAASPDGRSRQTIRAKTRTPRIRAIRAIRAAAAIRCQVTNREPLGGFLDDMRSPLTCSQGGSPALCLGAIDSRAVIFMTTS